MFTLGVHFAYSQLRRLLLCLIRWALCRKNIWQECSVSCPRHCIKVVTFMPLVPYFVALHVCSEMSGRDPCQSQCAVESSPQLESLSPPTCPGKLWRSVRQAQPSGCRTTLSTAAWVVTQSSGSADESITAGDDTQDSASSGITCIARTKAKLIQYSCISLVYLVFLKARALLSHVSEQPTFSIYKGPSIISRTVLLSTILYCTVKYLPRKLFGIGYMYIYLFLLGLTVPLGTLFIFWDIDSIKN
jgi:hypothetical protein